MAGPFSLTTGSSVWAQVVATNKMGSSASSSAGNGAVITYSTVPAAPISLVKDAANTFAGQITFSWSLGSYDGGQPVDYYQVSSDKSIGDWKVLSS